MDSINIREVRREAWRTLRDGDNYRRSILFTLLLLLLTNLPLICMYMFMPEATQSIISDPDMGALQTFATRTQILQLLILMFVQPAFMLSQCRFVLGQLDTGVASAPMALFDGLHGREYFLAVRANLWLIVMMYLWLMIPATMFVNPYIMFMSGSQDMSILLLLIASAVLMLAVVIHRMIAYSFQFMIIVRLPQTGAIMSLRLSTLLTRGRKWEIIKLYLSMIHLYIPMYIPIVLAYIAPVGDRWLALVMDLCTIVLGALLMPLTNIAQANYFRKLWSIATAKPMSAESMAEAFPPIGWPQFDDDNAASPNGDGSNGAEPNRPGANGAAPDSSGSDTPDSNDSAADSSGTRAGQSGSGVNDSSNPSPADSHGGISPEGVIQHRDKGADSSSDEHR